ncbi:MAG: NAD(P)H-binding protein [Thermodesulfobacteriota bacterium]
MVRPEVDMNSKTILLTGATGFIGGRLLRRLTQQGYNVRCLVRSKSKFKKLFPDLPEIGLAEGDLVQGTGLDKAMQGVDASYYLVHSMGPGKQGASSEFADRDRVAAENFLQAAENTGVDRIIYLSGLGDRKAGLSKHLSSRQEVGQILASGHVAATELRAGVIIGSGGASFEMIRYLAERLPVMVAPRWVNTSCQPIAVENVLDYLAGCLQVPQTADQVLEICGPEQFSYRELMLTYARVRGLKRFILTVPVLTPKLSSYWVQLVTPIPSALVRPLIDGLKNEVICRDERILDLIPVQRIPMQEAICTALAEEEAGPGALPSKQACLYTE